MKASVAEARASASACPNASCVSWKQYRTNTDREPLFRRGSPSRGFLSCSACETQAGVCLLPHQSHYQHETGRQSPARRRSLPVVSRVRADQTPVSHSPGQVRPCISRRIRQHRAPHRRRYQSQYLSRRWLETPSPSHHQQRLRRLPPWYRIIHRHHTQGSSPRDGRLPRLPQQDRSTLQLRNLPRKRQNTEARAPHRGLSGCPHTQK